MPRRRRSHLPPRDVIREFNDRGILWLLEDPTNLQDLLRIQAPELAERLDFTAAERLNRSFIPRDLRKTESDLVFRVPFRGAAGAVWVYLLLEHQSTRDPLMPLRLLRSMTHLWESQRRGWDDRGTPAAERRLFPVVPLVFYTGQEPWEGPLRLADLMEVPPGCGDFVPQWETLLLGLHRLPVEALTRFGSAVGWVLRALREERASFPELQQGLREALRGLEELPEGQSSQWERAVCFLLLLLLHRRAPEEYTELGARVLAEARGSRFHLTEEVAGMAQTAIEAAEARGEARGARVAQAVIEAAEARGQTRGVAHGVRAALAAVLRERFGELPADVEAALQYADAATLQNWLQRALRAERLEEVGILPGN